MFDGLTLQSVPLVSANEYAVPNVYTPAHSQESGAPAMAVHAPSVQVQSCVLAPETISTTTPVVPPTPAVPQAQPIVMKFPV